MMSDIAIRVENLSKRYRIGARQKRPATLRESLQNLVTAPFSYLRSTLRGPSEEEIIWALKDVSFEVKRGEVVGIIGRNGAGKSTLLKILSRITEPTAGRAEVFGRVGSLLEVGTGFHPELTGRENIYLNGAILGMTRKEIDRKFDEIVEFAEVEKFIDTPVKRYSSGMYVRLAFAVAAHLEPEVLLIDEVLAVGDTAFQNKCLRKILDLTQCGITCLFVTHNMHLIGLIAQQCLYTKNGNVHHYTDARCAIELYLSESQNVDMDNRLSTSQTDVNIGVSETKTAILSVNAVSSRGRTEIQPGEDLIVRIHYQSDSDNPPAHFNVSIWSENGSLVTSADTRLGGWEKFVPQARGEVVCCFPAPPLIAGAYSIRAFILSDVDWPLASFGWGDGRLCTFTVKPTIAPVTTYIKWGMTQTDYGVVKIPFRWEV
ncbi:MAG: ABC transporter ATP-binding protein [Abditibacteriales bacterium]|nr:ABC transporter ATP-binding protein [Abditibacteriales bacterium]